MFLGQYKYTTDDKGRLTIPVRFRAALASGAYIQQGFERNLIVYPAEVFEGISRKASNISTTNAEGRAVRRLVFGAATEVQLDSNGRVLLPDFLRSYAGLEGEAYIVGAGEYFEIWGIEDWERERASITDPQANARRFEGFDLSSG
jgi:MraZ protein